MRCHVARRGCELRVAVAPGHAPLDALEAWYRRQAREEVASRLDAAVARAGTATRRSRSAASAPAGRAAPQSGAMSFNWRLLLAPEEILDYVVEHEVAHLEVHDHSQRFWALLAARCPAWREHEAWLRRHGHALRPTPSGRSLHGQEDPGSTAQPPTTAARRVASVALRRRRSRR